MRVTKTNGEKSDLSDCLPDIMAFIYVQSPKLHFSLK